MNARRVFAAAVVAVLGLTFAPTQAQAAPEVYGLRYMAVSHTTTNVSWFKATEAVTYKIYVNGTLTQTVTDPVLITSITLPVLLGPADNVSAEAVAADGTKGAMMKATYRYLFSPYAPFIKDHNLTVFFDKGSGALTDAGAANVAAFVADVKKHGFTEIQVIGHNAVRVGTYNALTMAALRAENVMKALATQVTLPTGDVVHGVKVLRGAPVPATAATAELYFR